MATRLYSINRNENEFKVVEAVGSATVTKSIELTVDLAVGIQKDEVIRALRELENHILKGNWNPA